MIHRQPRQQQALPRVKRCCHYCHRDDLQLTRDHVVPKLLIDRSAPMHVVPNTVPACKKCNGRKGHKRSSCDCGVCLAAWATYGPEGWRQMPTFEVCAEA